ncbi:MAG: TetR/AcrR family transcriptional regulator [Emcibacteraceae bacterium]|nr:TetR/AcrR family transcriptional regulator [Emcibacteraceae bacterium]
MRQKIGKEKIVKAALMLFSENGYHKTSISQIAKKADVSKGLTYNYFKSKEELLLYLIDEATNEMLSVSGDLKPSLNYEETLEQTLEQFVLFLKQNKNYLTFQLSLLFQPDLRKIVIKPLQRRAEHLLRQTKAMFDKAGIDNPTLTARRFLAELDGIALHELSVFKNYPLDEMHKQIYNSYRNINK